MIVYIFFSTLFMFGATLWSEDDFKWWETVLITAFGFVLMPLWLGYEINKITSK